MNRILTQEVSEFNGFKDATCVDVKTLWDYFEIIKTDEDLLYQTEIYREGVAKMFKDGMQDNKHRKKFLNEKKAKFPCITPSSLFEKGVKRSKTTYKELTEVICIDIDDKDQVEGFDLEKVKDALERDRYCLAVHTTVSGKGLAFYAKIDSFRFIDAFEGLKDYFLDKYRIVIDKSCSNVDRLRVLSHDSDIRIGKRPLEFQKYIQKRKKVAKTTSIYLKSDVEDCVVQIETRSIDLTEEYSTWVAIGFALQKEPNFRDLFHRISKISNKYDEETTDRWLDYVEKNPKDDDDLVTISTFFHHCKLKGIKTSSAKSDKLKIFANTEKGSGNVEDNVNKIVKLLGEDNEDIRDFAKNLLESPEHQKIDGDMFVTTAVLTFLKSQNIRLNTITMKYESKVKELDGPALGSLLIKCRLSIGEDRLPLGEFKTLLRSNEAESYDPFIDWWQQHQNDPVTTHLLDDYLSCIRGPLSDKNDLKFKELFIKPWFYGIASSVFGERSQLLLLLTGIQGTGKTDFFFKIMPKELSLYFAEMNKDAQQIDHLRRMTNNLIYFDDEFSVTTKIEETALKGLMGMRELVMRLPYAEHDVRLMRIAMLCGTTNKSEFIKDDYNRRLIPYETEKVNREKIKTFNITALWVEIFRHWLENKESHWLSTENNDLLNKVTQGNHVSTYAGEIIETIFSPVDWKDKASLEKHPYLYALSLQQIEDFLMENKPAYKFKRKEAATFLKSKKCDNNPKRVWSHKGTVRRYVLGTDTPYGLLQKYIVDIA